MLFYQDLEEIIFTRSQLLPAVDQFVVVSGYVGIQPISRLRELDIPSQVIYGMYGANGIGAPLHRSLLRLENELSNTDIYYSQLPVHSKCYAWLKSNRVIHALVGSANFSVNGLNTDYRVTLAEATTDTYAPLKRYIDFVMENDFSEHSLNDFSYQSNMYGESAIVLSEADGKNENPYTPNSIKFPTAKNMQQVNDTGKWLDQKNTFFRNQLTQADVIKANEITPTTMIVNFISRQGGGNSIAASGVIGVKAKLYPVDSMDICNRCVTKYKDKQGLFNFIRFSTREISFFHDFLFAIDRAKIRAINMADKSNNGRMFNILERRADKNRFMSKLGKNDASAIASLVISQEEVEYMKKYFRFNLEQGASSKAVLEGYNLLNLVLVDESIEVAKFMADDGSGMFETVSFDALHRETRDGMKANTVMNILSKIQR
jgi:hypothetical protein